MRREGLPARLVPILRSGDGRGAFVLLAQAAKLSRIDPALLPTSLSALTELARLPIARILELELYGVLGPGLTARRIRSIGRTGPFTAMAEVEVVRVVAG